MKEAETEDRRGMFMGLAISSRDQLHSCHNKVTSNTQKCLHITSAALGFCDTNALGFEASHFHEFKGAVTG